MVDRGLILVSKRDVLGHTFFKLPSLAGSRNLRAGTICKFLGVLFGVLRRRRPSCLAITFSIRTPAFHRGVCRTCGKAQGPVSSTLQRRIPLVGRVLTTVKIYAVRVRKCRTSSLLNALTKVKRHTKVRISIMSKSHSLLRLTASRIEVHVPGAGHAKARVRSCLTTSIGRQCRIAPGRFVSMGTLVKSATSGVPNIPKVKRGATATLVKRCKYVRRIRTRTSIMGPPHTSGGVMRC